MNANGVFGRDKRGLHVCGFVRSPRERRLDRINHGHGPLIVLDHHFM
jgi:hypothetical protein